MYLKIYTLKDPRTNKTEAVYDYPSFYLPSDKVKDVPKNCITVSREVMKFPILSVPAIYLTEHPNERITSHFTHYWGNDLEDYFFSFDENLSIEGKYCRFVAKVITQLISPVRATYEDTDEKKLWWQILNQIDFEDFSSFLKTAFEKKFPWNYIKNTIEIYHVWNQQIYWTTYKELMEMFPLEVISDANELEVICDKILSENEKSVQDYKSGKKNAINHLKGQVMKATKGKANANVITIILEKKLNGI